MASSEMRDTDRAGGAAGTTPVKESQQVESNAGPAPRSPMRAFGAAERDRLLKEARHVQFPAGVRGYQRDAVDRYVERVSRLITELEMYSSPEAAVKHALDEVGEETREILQHAHQSAEEITVRSRAKAEERLQQAEQEAREKLDAAEQQAKETREAAQRSAREERESAQHEIQQLREQASHDAGQTRETAQREVTELRETAERETTEQREATARELEQLRAKSQRESEALVEHARREAQETLEVAESRTAELARSAQLLWRERKRLIEDVHAVGEQLVTLGDAEAKRFTALPEGPAPATNGEPATPSEQPATLA